MYYYFSASCPSVIKLDGIYYGKIEDVIKPIRIDDGAKPFIEVHALGINNVTFNAIIDDEFLSSPPDSVTVTDLKGGYFIKFNDCTYSPEFKIIAQQKFKDAVVTVFNENGIKISVETRTDFFADNLPFECLNAEISAFKIDGNNFIAVLVTGNKTVLYVYSICEKIRCVFMREVSSFSTQNGFQTTENLKDIAKHTITASWNYDGKSFVENSRLVKHSDNFNVEKLPQKLIPYAFLEELYAGGDVLPFVCDNVLENADKLMGYFGEFVGVTPPPTFKDIEHVGVVYAKCKNAYFVEYFTFLFNNGKICNINKID